MECEVVGSNPPLTLTLTLTLAYPYLKAPLPLPLPPGDVPVGAGSLPRADFRRRERSSPRSLVLS